MAFGKKYYSSYKSNNNLDYYLEIWVDGFDSSATEISVGAGGPVISYETDQEDRFSPIISSQCVLPFVVKNTTLQAFIQQLRTTYKERQIYLHLYRATSSTYTTTKPIWSGFLVMDLGSGEDVSFPYEQKLTFVDGLSLLKDIDFVDLSDTSTPPGDTIPLNERIQGNYDRLNMYYGPGLYTFWIKEILAKAGVAISGVDGQGVSIDYGFTTAVNWYNADMQNTNQGSDPLGLTKCVVSMFHNKNDQDVFTPENCYTVLKELLRHWGARITYWKHEFWIVQIPEYIQDESGLIDNPDNINSRQYNRFGTLTGSQDHLGDTYYTRYEQTIQSNQVSKLVGTKYNYLPMIHNAEADFLSFASKNYYGGFPYGVSAESQEIFQGTIIDPSTANFLWLSIPLNWTWDMTGSSLTSHKWWCSVKFNFYASDGTTTYYLQYDSSNGGSYYWVLEADWTPLGNTSPKYIIKSSNLTETNYIGFQEDIPFVDSAGSAITMTGAWSFFLDIEDYGSSSSNPGSFFCRFSGYGTSNYIKRNPSSTSPLLPFGSGSTSSGKVSWSNTLENPSGIVVASPSTPVGFDAGTTQDDIQLITTSAFKGYLQTLNTTQTSSFGLSLNTQVNNSTNTEKFSFGTLLWGDAIQQFAVGCLRVNNGTAFVKTNPDGEWGRGTLTGTNTFTELLIDEFLSGQIKVVIAPTMRLAVGEENKNQTASGTGGPATRPRYVNPIGRLREFRSNETDPEYIFRRGSFHSLYDEWDYEGYQILRDTVSATTTTTDIGDLGGTQDNKPLSNAKIIPNVTDALMLNSPVASIRTTVPATGSNVAVNGNFNTAVGWTLGTGWSIDTTAKKAKFAATGSTSELTQSVLTQGLTYQVNFQVVVTAGTLLVKAGTSGTSLSISTSGDYSFYLDCDGSNLIKFQAGTTFTGNITYITLRDQKSISAVPINSIGSTVFKSGDTFNLINSLGGEILPLTVSSNQGATDDTISVTSTALFDDIGIDSVLLINQDDLSAQYQNKTKGTVAGFGIDADGISKGGIEITGWLNSDTMSGAAVTNVPTALSVKNYVDGQVGASDTLAEVLANGNTTGGTNISVNDDDKITFGASADLQIYHDQNNSFIRDAGVGDLYLQASDNIYFQTYLSGKRWITLNENAGVQMFYNDSLKFETGSIGAYVYGSLLIGTTTNTAAKLSINQSSATDPIIRLTDDGVADYDFIFPDTNTLKIETNTGSTKTFKLLNAGSGGFNFEASAATFSGQVTIPATPVASTDAASKGYVDAQVSATDSLQEVTTVGNTTTNSIMIGSSSSPSHKLNVSSSNDSTAVGIDIGSNASFDFAANSTSGYSTLFYMDDVGLDIGHDSTARAINFKTGGSDKVTITGGGNVGIGTTSPSEKLHVVGDALITGDSHADAFKPAATGEPIKFKNFGSTELARITDSGNVGIGTTSPVSILSLVSATPIITSDATDNTVAHGIEFKKSGNLDAYIKQKPINGEFEFNVGRNSTWGGDFLFTTDTYDAYRITRDSHAWYILGSEKMRLTSGGYLGVSTTNPSEKLSVSGNIAVTNGAGVLIGGAIGDTKIGKLYNVSGVLSLDGDSTRSIRFGSTSNGEVMRVDNTNQRIGIGTSSPAYNLDTTGNIRATGYVYADDALVTNTIISAGSQDLSITKSGAYSIRFLTNGAERARITSGGNLLLGTTTDNGHKLQVNGDIQIGDNDMLRLGNSSDLKLYHTGTGTVIQNSVGNLTIQQDQNAGDIVFRCDDGIGGTALYFALDGGLGYTRFYKDIRFEDSKQALFGTGSDLKILHNGTDSFITNNGGDLNIIQYTNSKDVTLECDNGTGGTTPYITLDGSQTTINLQQSVLIGTTTNSGVYKLDVFGKARVQSVFELNDVLTLNQISTPADPASGQSSIYMDSADGAIKVKINVGGTVVTKTIASFE